MSRARRKPGAHTHRSLAWGLGFLGPISAGLISAGLASCAGGPRPAPSTSQQQSAATPSPVAPSALDRLAQRALQERSRPDADARALAPPQGVDTFDDPADPAKASLTLDLALDAMRGPAPTTPPEIDIDDESRLAALSAYARGRAAYLDSNPAEAARELQEAARLDPAAPEPWSLLAQVQLATGRRSPAAAAFQQALRRGATDPKIPAWLGRDALRAQRWPDAASLLARAWDQRHAVKDPAFGPVVAADLADASSELGYLLAARTLLISAASLEPALAERTTMRAEAAEILRRRPEFFLRAGDLALRMGDADGAMASYDRAFSDQAQSLDPGAVVARKVHALTRLGRPAAASLALLDDIRALQGRIDDRHLGLIRHLSRTSAGPLLGEAISQLAASPQSVSSPTRRALLVRAHAATLAPDPARATLLGSIAAHPDHAETAAELFLLAGSDPEQITRTLLDLTDASPEHGTLYADVALAGGIGVRDAMRALASMTTPPARLAHAALLLRTGRPAESHDLVSAAPWPEKFSVAALALRSEAAAAAARWDDLTETTQRLSAIEGVPAARAHARALRQLQRFPEALDAITPYAGNSVPDLVFTAELASRVGRLGDAEARLRKAVELDPADERGSEALFAFHASNGPRPDESRLTDTARALRQAVPSSRLLRALTARDMIAKGLWRESETTLLEILKSPTAPPLVLDLLGHLYQRTTDASVRARGEPLLRERLSSHPDSIATLAALARLLAAQAKGDEAVALCEDRLKDWPITDLARLKESILRDALRRPDDADAATKARLQSAPPTIENTLELAELLTRKNEIQPAADAVARSLPRSLALTREQSTLLLAIANRLPLDADPARPGAREAARSTAAFLDQLLTLKLTLPPPLRLKHLIALANGHGEDSPRLAAAAEQTAREVPEIGTRAFLSVVDTLSRSAAPRDSVAFTEHLVREHTPFDPAFGSLWAQCVFRFGDASDVRKVTDLFTDPARLRALLAALRDDLDEMPQGAPLAKLQAELAYRLAGGMIAFDRAPAGLEAFRAVLAIDPDHAYANNDLGYILLDSGIDTPEVATLIEKAYTLMPDRANVIDSIGWLRYHQARIDDTTDELGQVSPGALTLLTQASLDPQGAEDKTLNDHLGDTLWRAGKKDEALTRWKSAERLTLEEIQMFTGEPGSPETFAAKERRKLLESVRAKLDAVQGGREPPVTKFFREQPPK